MGSLCRGHPDLGPSALEKMTPGQRLVSPLGMLRQEVNSGGFDSYLDHTALITSRQPVTFFAIPDRHSHQ